MHLGNIHYNAHRRVFCAQLAIKTEGETALIPCEIAGDPTMKPSRVLSRLHRRACKITGSF